MFDAHLRPLIDPPLNWVGQRLARIGVTANQVTAVGGAFGLAAGVSIAAGHFGAALALIALSRLLDGLDGAVARATRKTDFGGYLDIVVDFMFYVAVPVGFGLTNPANLPFALVLVGAFTLTGISFLAFATLAAQRGLETTAHGEKSFFYNTGLAEGTETILAFVLMCLWPAGFPILASIFAGLCGITVVQRSLAARRLFGDF
ncbi:CDP-alcohol phosphatidyltransferase family protein (plasmid) [Caulobacter sp. ErkDOM-YI]|uniref:CDP-alcohol phosphatidyltransferase family protein n=1 Tax=unclassified Caulobacter TaxID=2648921 RepID=UPI003AF49DB1